MDMIMIVYATNCCIYIFGQEYFLYKYENICTYQINIFFYPDKLYKHDKFFI